jgi:hypothetical protein
MIQHIQTDHPDIVEILVVKDIPIKQYLFNIKNRKDPFNKFGKSILSGKPTSWNDESGRYHRILNSEQAEYRQMFRDRMIKIHGKDNLLNDPDVQKKLLAARSISGTYNYRGRNITYTGSYEKDFLEFLDNFFDWECQDLIMPCPHIINYVDPESGKDRFFIPDAYFSSLNLVVEIKSEKNNHYRKRDIKSEYAKDDAIEKTDFRYVKIFDKDYSSFINSLISIIEDGF